VRRDWLRKAPCKMASPMWRAIENAKKGLESGACYVVGDGKSINIWLDPWVYWIEGYKPKPKDDSIEQNPMVVESLINSSTRE
jgi:hypothetical protein